MTTEHKTTGLAIALVALCMFIAYLGGTLANARTITHTRTVTKSPYGKADKTVDGAQVNQGLAGLTCYVYAAKKTVVCRP